MEELFDTSELYPIPEGMKDLTSRKFIQIVKDQVGDFNEFMKLEGINMKDENQYKELITNIITHKNTLGIDKFKDFILQDEQNSATFKT